MDSHEVVKAKAHHTYLQEKKGEDASEYIITETKSSHKYLPNAETDHPVPLPQPKGRFSTHLAEDEPDPDEEDHVIELPSVSEWDVSRSVTQNKDRRDLKDHMDQIQSDIAVVLNQGMEAVSKWDYNKSYNEMKDTVEKFGVQTVEEVKKVKDPTGGLWDEFTTILSDVAVATMEELVGDNRRVVNKDVGFFRVDGDSSSSEDSLSRTRSRPPQNRRDARHRAPRRPEPKRASRHSSYSSTRSSSSSSEADVAVRRSSRNYDRQPPTQARSSATSSSSGEDMPFERQESIACADAAPDDASFNLHESKQAETTF